MESRSVDADSDKVKKGVKVATEESSVLDDSEIIVKSSVNNMSVEVGIGEIVTDKSYSVPDEFDIKGHCERNLGSELVGGTTTSSVNNCKSDEVNLQTSDVDRQNELSSVSSYTTVMCDDEDFNEALFEARYVELARGEETFDEELGLVQCGSNQDSSEGIVEALNIHKVATGIQNYLEINYSKIEVLPDELQSLDDVEETKIVQSTGICDRGKENKSCNFREFSKQNRLTDNTFQGSESALKINSEASSQSNINNASGEHIADNCEVVIEHLDGIKPNGDSSDSNNNSSEDYKDSVKFEVDDKTKSYAGFSQTSSDFTESVSMTCAQFIMLVNKDDDPKKSPAESELLISNIDRSNLVLKRLDTIASIEGDNDLQFYNKFEKDDTNDDSIHFCNASSNNDTLPLSPSVDSSHDETGSVEKPVVEAPVRRKSTGIFIKKHEKEGRSRSPSPIPRRYRKHSVPLQKHPVVLECKSGNEIAPVHSKSIPYITVEKSGIKDVPAGNEDSFTLGTTTSKTTDYFSKTQQDAQQDDDDTGNANVGLFESHKPSLVPAGKEDSFTINAITSKTTDYFTKTQQVAQQEGDDDTENENVGLLESHKPSLTQGQMKNRFRSGGSISDDDMPSVHRSRPIEINVKGKKVMYDLFSHQGMVSPEAPDDDFGLDRIAKKESKTDKFLTNEDIFTNKAVLTAYAHKKLRALRNSFRRERKRTVSSGSESTSSEPTRRRLESQSSLVLKLTERDDCNRDVIEGFIGPIKLPPKKQRTLSTGDENSTVVELKPKVLKSQRSQSHGHLGQTVPVTIRVPSMLTEPWKGAWDHTVLRIVEPNDTLASVAAHFDITPSELAILNRLPSRTVFPGQVIRVPDKRRRDPDSEDKENKQDNPDVDKSDEKEKGEDKSEVCDEEMDMLEKLRLTSPKPGHAERVRTPLSPTPDPTHQRFLKINVRHITDGQGVVSGVLLVTSNAVMFDPNVSDPLVIEHGPESYGVIAPMEYVVNVAIYHDIAHMRVGSHDQFRPDWPKPEVYHLKEPFPPTTDGEGEGSSGTLLTINQGDSLDSGDPHHSPSAREDSLLAKDETFPELRSSTEDEEEDAASLCSCSVPREGDAFPKAFDRDLVTPTNLSTTAEKQESEAEDPTPKNESVALIRSLEERRKSSLDHHWAVPSKVRSLEEQSANVSDTQVMDNNRRNSEGLLVKLSCHDSGIDIRDPPPPPVVPQVPRKSTYSDADVLLSDEFVPPVPIQPLRPAAVSFSLDQSQEGRTSESHDGINLRDKDDHEKETKKNKMLKRLSYPLSWMEGFSGDKEEKDSLPSSAESHPPSSHSASSSVFSKVFSSSPINMVTDFSSGLFTKTPSEEGGRFPFPPATPEPPPTPASIDPSKPQGLASFSPSNITSAITSVGRSSVGTFIRQQHQPHPAKDRSAAPKLDYRSMVSVEDMPELFVSFDIHAPLFPRLEGLELIPRPAQSCDDPPLYLRLRMGKPKDKKIPKSTPIMSYGKKKMRPEYWFSVPRERVDDLYRFLMVWVPQLYGDLEEATVADRGYELVDSDTELWETEDSVPRPDGRRGSDDDDIGDLTRESWEVLKAPYCKLYTILKTQATMGSSETGEEVLSMSEELRRALYASSSLDLELCVPDLNGVTEILSEDHRKQLCRHLPARAEGYVWTLVFSTSQHGFSLNSMYRKMTRIESPILMVIQDTENNVFGALTSCALKMSDHFYGTGESLLFRFAPDCQVYNWTGDNMYFIKGNNESLSIGAGDGKFGLWLDGDLYQGRTEPCNTYGNDPLTPSVDFVVKTLECWAFI